MSVVTLLIFALVLIAVVVIVAPALRGGVGGISPIGLVIVILAVIILVVLLAGGNLTLGGVDAVELARHKAH